MDRAVALRVFQLLRLTVVACSLILLALSGAGAQSWQVSRATNVREPPKRAVLIVSGAASLDVASRSAEQYRSLLADLGFDTLVVGPADRPMLDQQIRRAAEGVPGGSWLAVFVVGETIARKDDVFILPSGAPPDLSGSSPTLPTEAIGLSFVLRKLSDAAPAVVVAIADDCRAPSDLAMLDPIENTLSASVACIIRPSPRTGERDVVTGLSDGMTSEGATFEQVVNGLRNRFRPPQPRIAATAALSPVFSFFPRDHFQQVETGCSRINPEASEGEARNPAIGQLVRDCESTVTRYPYVQSFARVLAAGREQQAFQRSTSDCATASQPGSYLDRYPTGRYARAADEFRRRCAQPAPAPEPSPAELVPGGPPSFNCRAAGNAAEQLICASGRLSGADRELAAAFRDRMASLGESSRRRLREDERLWLAIRDGSCGLPRTTVANIQAYASAESCLLEVIWSRTRALR